LNLSGGRNAKSRQTSIINSRRRSRNTPSGIVAERIVLVVQRAKVIVALLDDPKLNATNAGLKEGFARRQSGVTWVNWNNYRHPYTWKKRPHELVKILGGFGVQIRSDSITT